jgi:hypothetical protein
MFTKIRHINAQSVLGAAAVACAFVSANVAAANQAANSGHAAAPVEGPTRPAVVPADFVTTPFGYYHPSCVNHLANGDVLHQDEKTIERANGTYEGIAICAHPHFRADGEKVIGDERAVNEPNISHSWIESASVTTSSAYGLIHSEWDVPAAPTNNDGQTLFFFNGLEDINDQVSIIQPVLGWNSDFSGAWGIAAWNCCVNGTVWEGTPARVNTGDHLIGTVETATPGIMTGPLWIVDIEDLQNGSGSLLLTSSYNQTFNWAFGGVLEVYGIIRCGDYPAYNPAPSEIGFYNQSLYSYNFVPITPAWTVNNWSSGLTPQCNYGGSLPQQVTLTW